ncbi:MAG TPA: hypothetical protein VHH34_08740 [Pseudonocardiaceae bacterium]|nr:hypothetical protein [Pseudonocardiaceae bacterium]
MTQPVISVSVPEPATCPDTHIAVNQEANRYAADRMAATAAAKAKRLWPDVIGEVLADEIMGVLDLPSWLRTQTRTQRLIDAILAMTEGPRQSCEN